MRTPRSAYIAMGFIAMAVLMCEVTWTKIFSVLLWFHFGYLIISLALLGLGAAGSYLAVARLEEREDGGEGLIVRCAYGLSFAIALSFALVTRLRLYPLEMFKSKSNLVVFALDLCILVAPFFLAGVCMGWLITRYRRSIARLYAFDLVGAGLGSALAMLLINWVGAPPTMIFSALLVSIGAFLLDRGRARPMPLWRALVLPVLMLGLFVQLTRLTPVSEMLQGNIRLGQKETWRIDVPLSKELFYQQFENVEYSKWNAIARVDVTTAHRSVPAFGAGVSSMFKRPPYEPFRQRLVTQDGTAPTVVWEVKENFAEELPFLVGTTQSFAYQILKDPKVCVIGVGGGIDILIALRGGATSVDAVEVDPLMIEVITDVFKDFTGGVFNDPRIRFVPNEGRHHLASTNETYDVIQMSGVDTYAALASGAYVLAENYLYTVEAIRDIWDHLNPDGVWSVSRWFFVPPRETLRLAVTAYEALEQMGVENPERHLMVCHDTSSAFATILMKKSEFTPEQVDTIIRFCEKYDFGVYYDPYHSRENTYHQYIGQSEDARRAFLKRYYYNVRPTTDDSPFFFQWYKLKHALGLSGKNPHTGGGYLTTTTPLGLRLLLLTVILLVGLAVTLIIYPLRRVEGSLREIPHKTPWLVYYACLGTAFIFAEIVMIQKFIIYLGAPLYSLALVLGGLLVFSGLGSQLSGYLAGANPLRCARRIVPVVAAGLLIDWFLIKWALPATLRHDLGVKILISIALIGPMGLLLGMPFPLGVRALSDRSPALIPWVWGVNACFSVVGTMVCVFLSMLVGFQTVFVSAAALYLVAFAMLQRVTAPHEAGGDTAAAQSG